MGEHQDRTTHPWPYWMLRFIATGGAEEAYSDLVWSVGGSPPYGGVGAAEADAVYELLEAAVGPEPADPARYERVAAHLRGRPQAVLALEAFRLHERVLSGYDAADVNAGRTLAAEAGHPGLAAYFAVLAAELTLRGGEVTAAKDALLAVLPRLTALAADDPVYVRQARLAAQRAAAVAAQDGDARHARIAGAVMGVLGADPRLAASYATDLTSPRDLAELAREGSELLHAGNLVGALERFGRAEEVAAAQGREAETCGMLGDMAVAFNRAGNPRAAIATYRRAIELSLRYDDALNLSRWTANLVGLLVGQGELDAAEGLLGTMAAAATRTGRADQMAIAETHTAAYLSARRRHEEAVERLTLAGHHAGDDPLLADLVRRETATVHLAWAEALHGAGEREQAAQALRTVVRLADAGDPDECRLSVRAHLLLAELHDSSPPSVEQLLAMSRPDLDAVVGAWAAGGDLPATEAATPFLGWLEAVQARQERGRAAPAPGSSAGGAAGMVHLAEQVAEGKLPYEAACDAATALRLDPDAATAICVHATDSGDGVVAGTLIQLVADTTPDLALSGRLHRLLVGFASSAENDQQCLDLIVSGLARLAGGADDALRAELLNEGAVHLARLGRPEESLRYAREARDVAEREGLGRLARMAAGNEGTALITLDRHDEALAVLEPLAAAQEAHGEAAELKITEFNLRTLRLQAGDRTVRFAGDSADPDEVFQSAVVAYQDGDLDAATKLFERGFALLREGREAHNEVPARRNYAEVLAAAGRVDEALEELGTLAAGATEHRPGIAAAAYLRMADLAPGEALSYVERARGCAVEAGDEELTRQAEDLLAALVAPAADAAPDREPAPAAGRQAGPDPAADGVSADGAFADDPAGDDAEVEAGYGLAPDGAGVGDAGHGLAVDDPAGEGSDGEGPVGDVAVDGAAGAERYTKAPPNADAETYARAEPHAEGELPAEGALYTGAEPHSEGLLHVGPELPAGAELHAGGALHAQAEPHDGTDAQSHDDADTQPHDGAQAGPSHHSHTTADEKHDHDPADTPDEPDAAPDGIRALERAWLETGELAAGVALARAYTRVGRATAALGVLAAARNRVEQSADPVLRIEFLTEEGLAHRANHDTSAMLASLGRAHQLATAGEPSPAGVTATHEWGVALTAAGRADEAVEVLESCLPTVRALGGHPTAEAYLSQVLAQALNAMGDPAGADRVLRGAAETFRAEGDARGLGRTMAIRGEAALALDDLDAALRHLRAAAELTERVGDCAAYAAVQQSLATVHMRAGEAGLAAVCHERAAAGYRELGAVAEERTARLDLVECHLLLGDTAAAGAAYQPVLAPDAALIPALASRTFFLGALLTAQRGDWWSARPALRQYLDGVARDTGRAASSAELWRRVCDADRAYELAGAAAVAAGDATFGVEVAEGRRTAFFRAVVDRDARRPEGVAEAAWSAYQRAAEDLADLRAERRAAATLDPDPELDERLSAAGRRHAAAFRAVFGHASPPAAAALPALEEVTATLPPDVVAAYVDLVPTLTVLCVARDGWTAISRRPGVGPDELPATGGAALPAGQLDAVGRLLGRELWQPLLELLPEGTAGVVLLPSARLAGLPLAAARLPDGKQVSERIRIAYAPSLALLRRAEEGPGTPPRGLGQAVDPTGELPFSRRQSSTIASHAAASVTTLCGPAATMDAVRQLLRTRDVVHFAGRGRFEPDDPMRSYLRCAGEDGRLSVARLFADAGAVRSTLVVLSACESGAGAGGRWRGEAVGLPGTVLVAGAQQVIATHWAVGDLAAALIAGEFFRCWRQGAVPAATALAQAQRRIRTEMSNVDVVRILRRWAAAGPDDDALRAALGEWEGRPQDAPAFAGTVDWAAFHLVGVP